MPSIFQHAISRKQFLQLTSASLAGTFLSAARRGMGEESPTSWHLALVSDTHVPQDENDGYRGFRPVENLRQVVPQIVAAAPDAVMLSGDAARLEGKREDYQRLKSLLDPVAQSAPVVIGLGNHDDRRNFFAEFPIDSLQGHQSVSDKHVALLEHPLMRIVMLDSLLYVNKVAGLLGKAQRAWLKEILPRTADRPLALFVHHTLGDGDGDLLDTDRLFSILRPHSHVKAIFFGHSHRYEVTERDSIKLINLPATGYNFADNQPVGWIDAFFHADRVEMTLRCVGGNREHNGETTTVAWSAS